MSRKRLWCLNLVGAMLVGGGAVATAQLRLPAVISDNMVLQRGRPVPLWGWAQPGETVKVTIAEAGATAQAGEDGRWQVRLPALEVQEQGLEMVIAGSSGSCLRVKNVMIGEVWLCTGPSNIFWPVKSCDHARQEIASATYPQIRFFTVGRRMADQPQADCEGRWVECSPANVPDVSGVGYFFARQLHQDLKMPVGLVQSFWGGSRLEAWTSLEALQDHPALRPVLDYWKQQMAGFDAVRSQADYEKTLTAWQEAAARAQAAGTKPPAKPKLPADPRTSNHRPACLFNGMIAPLIPYGMRGAITYQGLGNLFWAEHSRVLLETMIADWRRRWGQGDFPIGMVQPAPYTCQGWAQSSPDSYAIQRESQLLVLQQVPHIGLAATMDIDAVNVLHFPQKQPVAHRLALWALGAVYGRPGAYQGPIFRAMTVEGDRIRIRFRHTEGGLRTSDGRSPTCFTIAGPDRLFQPATATIEADTIVVRSDRIPRPVAVRFAWGNTDVPNLCNGAGFPAPLFRTDGPP
jgi:sialate O-acetylesterase